ncbi:MAG: RNA polymerase sigma-70 factor [Flavisolibacter sp.]
MSDTGDINENELLERVAGGDQNAYAQLFDRYHHTLGHFIFGITKSRELAEEVTLDSFLKIWMTREVLVEVKNFKAYLFTISRNAAISALRKIVMERRHRFNWAKEPRETATAEEPDKEAYLSLIDEAINQLSPQRKKVYLLSRQKGMKYEEIATEMGISKFTVRAHIQQAVASILDYVKPRVSHDLMLVWLVLSFL